MKDPPPAPFARHMLIVGWRGGLFVDPFDIGSQMPCRHPVLQYNRQIPSQPSLSPRPSHAPQCAAAYLYTFKGALRQYQHRPSLTSASYKLSNEIVRKKPFGAHLQDSNANFGSAVHLWVLRLLVLHCTWSRSGSLSQQTGAMTDISTVQRERNTGLSQ